jgi:hypothetical protein
MLLKSAQIITEYHIILNFLLQQLVSELHFTVLLKSTAEVTLVCKAKDEIRSTISFKSFRAKKINGV